MSLHDRVRQAFERRFGEPPGLVVRAPGRVNLIGEHTDYNDGFVLPMAIDRAIWIALSPLDGRQVDLYSLDFDQSLIFSVDDPVKGNGGWVEYPKGVAWALREAGYHLQGWRGVVIGDVPVGAGLSSSAAFEMGIARAFAIVSDFSWHAVTMARLGQRAENEWVGVNCGIMDQMISAAGKAGHALLMDCRTLDTQPVPLPHTTAVAILDTNTRRGLLDSVYNERRAQCEAAARFFGVPALRDVNLVEFEDRANQLDDEIKRRARHIVTENERTLLAADAMKAQDAKTLGQLMIASHVSLRDDFEVSSHELNVMTECALQQESCFGARMTGAGFGGCAVALVRADAAEVFAAAVAVDYQAKTQLTPAVYISAASNGAEVFSNPD